MLQLFSSNLQKMNDPQGVEGQLMEGGERGYRFIAMVACMSRFTQSVLLVS